MWYLEYRQHPEYMQHLEYRQNLEYTLVHEETGVQVVPRVQGYLDNWQYFVYWLYLE